MTTTTILAHDRNGDPVYAGTPLHAKPNTTASRIASQCDKYPDCIELVADGFKIERSIRISKRSFPETLWTVKPWTK